MRRCHLSQVWYIRNPKMTAGDPISDANEYNTVFSTQEGHTIGTFPASQWSRNDSWFKYIPTVYPKKYAHGFCFAVLCCGYTLTNFPISIRLTSLALWQSNDCPNASKATLMNMDKYFIWIKYERLHNHNKTKHNKTMCIFLGIYCRAFLNNPECHSSNVTHLQDRKILGIASCGMWLWFSILFHRLIYRAFLVKFRSGECHIKHLIISPHWFR